MCILFGIHIATVLTYCTVGLAIVIGMLGVELMCTGCKCSITNGTRASVPVCGRDPLTRGVLRRILDRFTGLTVLPVVISIRSSLPLVALGSNYVSVHIEQHLTGAISIRLATNSTLPVIILDARFRTSWILFIHFRKQSRCVVTTFC